MTALVRRPARPAAAALLMLLVALAWSLLSAAPAYAASDDQIDSYTINYEVRDTGVVRVTETITYRFGDNSGRHGIERYLVVREPYDESQDAVYGITQIDVTSPDPGIATQWSRTDSEAKGGREVQARLRIGDPDETISADTATYVIAYDLSGAMRTSGSYDEFYWDATGLDWTASIKQVDITASVPGGVQDTTCTYGPVNSTQTVHGHGDQRHRHLPAEQPGRRRRRHHQRQDQVRPARRQRPAPRTGRLQAVPDRAARRDRRRRRRTRRADRVAAGRRALVAQARPRPALRRSRPGHHPAGRPDRPHRGQRSRPPHPGRVLATADPGGRGGSAGRRSGGRPGDGRHHHRPRRPRRADGAELRRGRVHASPWSIRSGPPHRTRWCC